MKMSDDRTLQTGCYAVTCFMKLCVYRVFA